MMVLTAGRDGQRPALLEYDPLTDKGSLTRVRPTGWMSKWPGDEDDNSFNIVGLVFGVPPRADRPHAFEHVPVFVFEAAPDQGAAQTGFERVAELEGERNVAVAAAARCADALRELTDTARTYLDSRRERDIAAEKAAGERHVPEHALKVRQARGALAAALAAIEADAS